MNSMKTAMLKHTEKASQEILAFHQKLLDTSPDIIYIYDIIDRKIIYSNQGITKILGYSIEEIQTMGENILPQLMHPDDFNVYLKEIMPRYQSAKDEENIEHEYRMKRVDGSWRWLHAKESIFTRLVNGKPKQIFGLTSDVTENKQTYKKLETSEEKYRELFNNMSNGVCIYEAVKGGKDFIIKDINKAGEEITNMTKEYDLGKSIFEVRPSIEEFGLADVFRRVFKTGKSEIHDERLYEDKNLTGYFKNFVCKLESGEIVAIFENITRRKQAEEALIETKNRLLKAQNVAGMGFLDWNLQTNEIELSEEVVNLYGLEKGKNWVTPDLVASVVHPDDLTFVQQNLELAIKDGKKYNIDHRVVRPDGKVLWVNAQAEISRDTDGIPLKLLGTVVEITERKKAEEALRESRDSFRFLAENAKDMIYRMSLPEGHYEYVSPASSDIFGYTPEEFYNNPILIKQVIHPAWGKYFENLWSKLLAGDSSPFYEFQIIHKSGETRWLHQRNAMITNDKGEPVAIEGIVTDITASKEAEKELIQQQQQLEELVKERTRELEVKNQELEQFNNLFVGREFRIKELRDQVEDLENQIAKMKKET